MTSLITKLKQALTNTTGKISSGIEHIFLKKKLDEQTLAELEELLITADIRSTTVSHMISKLKQQKFNKEVQPREIKEALAKIINDLLPPDLPFILNDKGVTIILVCGVNGNGKTTTIGKLASNFTKSGKKVMIAACDTFRAAAVEQIDHWAQKSGASLFKGEPNADPASVAYNALKYSKETNTDILFIDTAGRLQNYKNLMDELSKIIRTIKKFDDTAPHHNLLVLDATTGQNAQLQIEQFKEVAQISGIIITKLDGSAKAGVIVGVSHQFNLPIHFIGIGEKIEDLKAFNSEAFANALLGI